MRLLVSVRDPEEARLAVQGGADIIDVKNPLEGSLGAPVPDVIRAIRETVPLEVPVSVAIGDMPYLPGTAALAAWGAASLGVQFVKVGLWGPTSRSDGIHLLNTVRHALSAFPDVRLIAVGYADAAYLAHRPVSPMLIPEIAASAGADGCMLDTANKAGQRLLDILTLSELRAFVRAARRYGLIVALAGRLQMEDLDVIRPLEVDIVGVRSAVCHHGIRTGTLDPERVRTWKRMLKPACVG